MKVLYQRKLAADVRQSEFATCELFSSGNHFNFRRLKNVEQKELISFCLDNTCMWDVNVLYSVFIQNMLMKSINFSATKQFPNKCYHNACLNTDTQIYSTCKLTTENRKW